MRIRLAVLTLAALLGFAGPAAAEPVSSPEPGALLTRAPARVTLALDVRGADLRILVTDAAGVRRDVGPPAWEGTVASVDLAPGLAAGSYTVDWRLVDAGGAPRAGTFLFTLSPAVESATAALEDDAVRGLGAPALWLAAGLVLVVGGLALARSVGGPRR